MHAYYVSTLIELLAARGIDQEQLLRGTGIACTDLREPFNLRGSQLDDLCSNALALTGDQQFGLRLGANFNIPSQGIFGYALMTSATVGDALHLLIRYGRALMPSIRIALQQRAGTVDVLVQATHLPLHLERFYCEVLYAAIVHNGSLLIGDRGVVARVELDYSAPQDDGPYRQLLGPDIQFESECCALRFDEKSLSVPISTANPVAQAIFRRECDRLSALDPRNGRVSEQVQQLLLQAGSEFPTANVVARQLNMSGSTLQRRLLREGCKYQQVLDQVRYRLAREYLLGTTLPVAEIACLLGFSDTANFRRSFRRWSGTTPVSMRDSIATYVTASD